MSLTLEQIINEARKIGQDLADEFKKNFFKGKDRLNGMKKSMDYLHSITQKHPGDFDFKVGMEAVRLAIQKLEPNEEKAKETFLEFKLNAYIDYEELEPKDELVKKIKKLSSATKIKDIKESLNELDMPFEDYHKTQLHSLLKELKKDKKRIYNIFKNNKTDQYKGSILTLATYIEILLSTAINYRFARRSNCSDDNILEYFSSSIIKASQKKRIEIGKEIGSIDKGLFKRLKRFNDNRNKYIHNVHMVKNGVFPYKLYADGRIIIDELEKIIFDNLPGYIKGKTHSIDELIKVLEKEFNDKQQQLLDDLKNKYENSKELQNILRK